MSSPARREARRKERFLTDPVYREHMKARRRASRERCKLRLQSDPERLERYRARQRERYQSNPLRLAKVKAKAAAKAAAEPARRAAKAAQNSKHQQLISAAWTIYRSLAGIVEARPERLPDRPSVCKLCGNEAPYGQGFCSRVCRNAAFSEGVKLTDYEHRQLRSMRNRVRRATDPDRWRRYRQTESARARKIHHETERRAAFYALRGLDLLPTNGDDDDAYRNGSDWSEAPELAQSEPARLAAQLA